jgi:hypothetical protein
VAGESPIIKPGLLLNAVPKTKEARSWIVPKVKMNQPCPCGSGKKYKACHGDPKKREELGIKL